MRNNQVTPAETDAELKALGDRINARMYEKRMNVTDLSRLSGVDRVLIYKIFSGKGYNITSIVPVCLALEMPLSSLRSDIAAF